jgi:dipeptidyl aminopeptidase/acylaminoacyl peptidase
MNGFKNMVLPLIAIIIISFLVIMVFRSKTEVTNNKSLVKENIATESATPLAKEEFPLQIQVMRKQDYPGSDLTIEQTLSDGSNYKQYIASYKSEGLKIYGLLTIPKSQKPEGGYPVIIFNHGYIPPKQYKTIERYVSYVAAFASNGYIVFKSDYRGHGNSEGQAEGAYYATGYNVDVLNALATLKKYKDANPEKIGMWGHSMGGNITLRSLVVRPNDIKAAVIWGGVVGTYNDLMYNWQRNVTYSPPPDELALRNKFKTEILDKHGTPKNNPDFWNSIDPNSYLSDITAPIQLHTGLSDEEVPWQFSQGLTDRIKQADKTVEFYTYPGAEHNISAPSYTTAMKRSVDFFNKYLK